MGIGVTRALAAKVDTTISFKKSFSIFSIDMLTKAVIFPIIFTISMVTMVFMAKMLKIFYPDAAIGADSVENSIDIYEEVRFSVLLYALIVPSFIICSAWVWLYVVSLYTVRLAIPVFKVDEEPLRSIGTVGAVVLTVCYGLYATVANIRTVGSSPYIAIFSLRAAKYLRT